MSSLDKSDAKLWKQEDRIEYMKQMTEKAAIITVEKQINRALKLNITPSANYVIKTGQAVMVYSEKKGKGKWIKGLTLVLIGSKMICVNDEKRTIKLNRNHVVPQHSDDDQS